MENAKTPKIVADLLEAAQKELGVTADNALAVRLGWHRQVISNYRQGTKPTNENLLILCETAKWNFNATLAEVERAFAKTETAKKRWENYFRQLGGIAAGMAITLGVIVTMIVTSNGLEASPLLAFGPGTFCIM